MSDVIFPTQIPDGTTASDDRLLLSDTSDSGAAFDAPLSSLPISTATQSALDAKESTANKGIANGYAPLDATGKVPAANLPTASGTGDVTQASNSGSSGRLKISAGADKSISDYATAGIVKSDANGVASAAVAGTDYLAPNGDGSALTGIDASQVSGAQATLVSGTNIKTLNGESILGSGNLSISAGSGGYAANVYLQSTASTTVGAYNALSYVPELTTSTVSAAPNNNEVLLETFIYDADVGATLVDAGEWSFNTNYSVSSPAGVTKLRYVPFKRTSGGTETDLFSVETIELNATTATDVITTTTQPSFVTNDTDRLGLRIFTSTTNNSAVTVAVTVGDGNASYFNTPLAIRHSQLRARDAEDSHPISAITDLQSTLDGKADLGGATFTGDVSVPDEAYDATTWNGNNEVPTKNAIRDKIESMAGDTVPVSRGGTGLTSLGTASQQLRVNAGGTSLEYFTPSSGGGGGPSSVLSYSQGGTAFSTTVNGFICARSGTLNSLVISLASRPTGSNLTVDLRKNGTSVLSATLSITTTESATNGYYTVKTGDAGKATIVTASYSAGDVYSLVIVAGSTFPGATLTVEAIGTNS